MKNFCFKDTKKQCTSEMLSLLHLANNEANGNLFCSKFANQLVNVISLSVQKRVKNSTSQKSNNKILLIWVNSNILFI